MTGRKIPRKQKVAVVDSGNKVGKKPKSGRGRGRGRKKMKPSVDAPPNASPPYEVPYGYNMDKETEAVWRNRLIQKGLIPGKTFIQFYPDYPPPKTIHPLNGEAHLDQAQ